MGGHTINLSIVTVQFTFSICKVGLFVFFKLRFFMEVDWKMFVMLQLSFIHPFILLSDWYFCNFFFKVKATVFLCLIIRLFVTSRGTNKEEN